MGRTWRETCADPVLAGLPFKMESDEWGNVVVGSPTDAARSDYQGEAFSTLLRLLPEGLPRVNYPLQTSRGVKVVDVAWLTRACRARQPKSCTVALLAPEICVEVFSPRNSVPEIAEKMRLYFERGAQECWTCDRRGAMSFFDPSGPVHRSKLCPNFPVRIKRS